MRVVLRIGGSVVASPINPKLIGEYADLLKQLSNQGHQLAVVVGGGTLAREFINIAKKLQLDQNAQDDVAISVSRIFAQLLLKKLGNVGCEILPTTVEDAAKCMEKEKVIVMGGLKPGMTTDTVAALVAERVKASLLVKATDQDGVYDRDPRKHVDAVKLDHVRLEDLSRVLAESKHKAGIHQIIDPEAIKILRRSRIKVIVLNGFDPRNVQRAVDSREIGTLID